jgi:MFS family permease
MPLGAKMPDFWGHRMSIAVGCGFVCLGLTIMSLTTSWLVFLGAFIICCACAVATGYIPALHCGWAYFPHLKGRVSGIILCFFGFGAFIFSIVGTAIVNPTN